jgi:hypothetical protein
MQEEKKCLILKAPTPTTEEKHTILYGFPWATPEETSGYRQCTEATFVTSYAYWDSCDAKNSLSHSDLRNMPAFMTLD